MDELRRELVQGLRGDAAARREALARIAALPRETIGALIEDELAAALTDTLGAAHRTDQRGAADVIAPLLPLSDTLCAALRAALASPSARLRWGVAYTLGRGLDATPELWPAALETMMLDDGDQRWAAAELACKIARRDPSVLDEIRAALGGASATLRKMALYCLRDLEAPDAPRLAHELLRDPDAGVRLAALSCVLRAGSGAELAREAAATIAALLVDDPDAGVRRAAAATLGKLGVADPGVFAALERASRSEDPSLARAAAAALQALAPARGPTPGGSAPG